MAKEIDLGKKLHLAPAVAQAISENAGFGTLSVVRAGQRAGFQFTAFEGMDRLQEWPQSAGFLRRYRIGKQGYVRADSRDPFQGIGGEVGIDDHQ